MFTNRPVMTLALTGTTIVILSEIIYHAYNIMFGAGATNSQNIKALIIQEQQANFEKRKPNKIWNTAIFFPDFNPSNLDSPTKQLLHYFESAKMSIHICIYLASHASFGEIIKKKYDEGLLIQIITDKDTFTAHNSCAIKYWRRAGVEVRMKHTGDMMHHKFAIIDEEALLTGSLNWTKQGASCNQENVLVTTDRHIVHKYMKEFKSLWSLFAEPNNRK